jgi:hypothetical protein
MPRGGAQDRVINCGRLRTTTLEGPTTSSRGGPIKGFPLFLAQPGGPSGGRLRTTTLEGPKTSLSWAPPPGASQCASCPGPVNLSELACGHSSAEKTPQLPEPPRDPNGASRGISGRISGHHRAPCGDHAGPGPVNLSELACGRSSAEKHPQLPEPPGDPSAGPGGLPGHSGTPPGTLRRPG